MVTSPVKERAIRTSMAMTSTRSFWVTKSTTAPARMARTRIISIVMESLDALLDRPASLVLSQATEESM